MATIPKKKPKKKAPVRKKTKAKAPPKSKQVKPVKKDQVKNKATAAPSTNTKDIFEKAKKEDKPRASALSVLDNMNKTDSEIAAAGDKKSGEITDSKKTEATKGSAGAESGENKTSAASQTEKAKDPKETKSENKTTDAAKTEQSKEPKDSKESKPEEKNKGTSEGEQSKNAADTEKSKDTAESKLPEGVSKEQATKVGQQIQDFANLATHLPGILKMGDEIKAGGIQSKHTEALEAAYGPMKGVLTPENIQAFKNLDTSKVDKLLSKENLDMLKVTNPKLAETLNPEKIDKLKKGLEQAQAFLDKDKLARNMSMMAPFVDTAAGEGAISTVSRMVGDRNQLGGDDQKLSLTDIGPVTQGLLRTGPVRGIVNGKIAGGINQAVHYRKNGRERFPAVQRGLKKLTSKPRVRQKIYKEAWSQINQKAPGMARQKVSPYLNDTGPYSDRNIRRNFNDSDVRKLMDVGKKVQSMRGQTGSSGIPQVDNANQAIAGMTGILHKSVIGDDGAISKQELDNVGKFGTQLYRYMGLLYTGAGGSY